MARLPATLSASGGLQVEKVAGAWTFSPDWSVLSSEATIADPSTKEVWLRDTETDVYSTATLETLLGDAAVFPDGSDDFSATGGSNQILRQLTLGGPITVGAIPTFNGSYAGAVPASPGTATVVMHGDSSWAAVNLTNTVTGILPTANGGTNLDAGNSVAATFVSRSVVATGISGSTNNSSSGSGAFVDHTPTATIPANFLISGRVLRVTALFRFTTGSASPNMNFRLKLGSTVVGQYGPSTPVVNMTTRTGSVEFMVVSLAAPSGSSNTETTAIGNTNQFASTAFLNSIAQPVALATNGALTLTMGSQWDSAGTGTNTVTLMSLSVVALN